MRLCENFLDKRLEGKKKKSADAEKCGFRQPGAKNNVFSPGHWGRH